MLLSFPVQNKEIEIMFVLQQILIVENQPSLKNKWVKTITHAILGMTFMPKSFSFSQS